MVPMNLRRKRSPSEEAGIQMLESTNFSGWPWYRVRIDFWAKVKKGTLKSVPRYEPRHGQRRIGLRLEQH